MVHLVGFTGSALIVMSVTMTTLTRLRVVGLAGGLAFVAYGVLLGAWPVVVTNAVTASINIFHLRTLARERPKLRRYGRSARYRWAAARASGSVSAAPRRSASAQAPAVEAISSITTFT